MRTELNAAYRYPRSVEIALSQMIFMLTKMCCIILIDIRDIGGIKPTYAPATHEAQSTEYDERRDRNKQGRCSDCGIQTYKKPLGRDFVPINNEYVLNGRCLVCKPLGTSAAPARPVKSTTEADNAPPAVSTNHGQHSDIEGGNGEPSAVLSVLDSWRRKPCWVWVVGGVLV